MGKREGKPKFRQPRTCPLCGMKFMGLFSHMKDEHERDAAALAYHLVREIRRRLNRRGR